MGRDRSVGIATRYGLDGPGIESRWRDKIFQNGSGAHPTSCTLENGNISWKKSGWGVALKNHPI